MQTEQDIMVCHMLCVKELYFSHLWVSDRTKVHCSSVGKVVENILGFHGFLT